MNDYQNIEIALQQVRQELELTRQREQFLSDIAFGFQKLIDLQKTEKK